MQDWLTEALQHPTGWVLSGLALGVIATRVHLQRKKPRISGETEAINTQLRKAQDELTRLQGRYQLLESSHQSLQTDLSQERSILMSVHAELARERSLRVNLELALETVRRERISPPQAAPTPSHAAAPPAACPAAQVPPVSAPPSTESLKELLEPINVELQAVRRELAERREPRSTPHQPASPTLAKTSGAIAISGTPTTEAQPARDANLVVVDPTAGPGIATNPKAIPRHASKAERELDNFFRRIQIDPAAAQNASPGSDDTQDPE